MIKIDAMKALKIGTTIGTIGLSIAKSVLEEKRIEKKAAEIAATEVAKALAKHSL